MTNTRVIDKERGPRDAICPRCGSDAEWSFRNQERTEVEVVCPDCGHFDVPLAEFETAQSEIAELDGPEDRR